MPHSSSLTRLPADGTLARRLHYETLCAAFALAVGMGFGRFAFTGMAPLMLHEGQLSMADNSLAASANYFGYLLGALLATGVKRERSATWCRLALAGTVVCTALQVLPLATWELIAIRFVAGGFSALVLIAGTVWLFQQMRHPAGAPLLFAGVGAGIFLSAEIVAAGKSLGMHSTLVWAAITLGALLCTVPSWLALHPHKEAQHTATAAEHKHPTRDITVWQLILAYGLAGYGYIITATFLPVLMKGSLGSIDPIQVWAVFGLGAIPSCLYWSRLHLAHGTNRALSANLVVQAIGVILPVLAPNLFGYLGSALLVGGSFLGTVTIALQAGQRLAQSVRFNLFAMLTTAYGIGQILGPLVSGQLVSHFDSFTIPLLTASGALLLAVLACLL